LAKGPENQKSDRNDVRIRNWRLRLFFKSKLRPKAQGLVGDMSREDTGSYIYTPKFQE
jgi:hypothetical protein